MNDQDYALVIGIGDYPLLKKLEGPVKDAEAVAKWMTGGGKVPKQNTYVVTSSTKTPARPILQEIDEKFEEILEKARALGGRRFYLYFAGHGCAHELRHVVLLMANAAPRFLNRGLDAAKYQSGLADYSPFPEQIFWYDCCRNYDRRVRGRPPEWTTDDPHPPQGLTQMVVYAAGFTEYANERQMIYSTKRGIFTRALLEGVQGAAAIRKDQQWIVTSRSLIGYLDRRVEQLASDENLRQQITVNPAGKDTELILATEVEPWQVEVLVKVPAGRLVVRNQYMRPIVELDVDAAGVQAIQLVPGVYQVSSHATQRQEIFTVAPSSPVEIDLTRPEGF